MIQDECLCRVESANGQSMEYYALEVDAILDTWEADVNRSRRLVPLFANRKFADRMTLKVVRRLVEDHLGLSVVR